MGRTVTILRPEFQPTVNEMTGETDPANPEDYLTVPWLSTLPTYPLPELLEPRFVQVLVDTRATLETKWKRNASRMRKVGTKR